MVVNREFLTSLDRAAVAANKALGVTPGRRNGALSDDPAEATVDLHDAAVELLRAVESLQNWAWDVTRELQSLGIELADE